MHRRRAEHADLLDKTVGRLADGERVRLAELARGGERFPRGRRHRAAVVFDDDEDHFNTPISSSMSTTAAAASGPLPRITVALTCSAAGSNVIIFWPPGSAVGRHLRDVDLLRREPALQRRIARQVDALLHAEHRRHRHLVHLDTDIGLAASAQHRAVDIDALDAVHDRASERVSHADPDLEATGVGGLVAEQDQIERAVRGLDVGDGRSDRRGSSLRIPIGAVDRQQHGLGDTEAGRVAQLLVRLGGTECQHRCLAAVLLDQSAPLLRPRTPRAGSS